MKDIPAETPAELESKHLWRIKQLNQDVSAILDVLKVVLIKMGMSQEDAKKEIEKAQKINAQL